jgi:hypothetical protein
VCLVEFAWITPLLAREATPQRPRYGDLYPGLAVHVDIWVRRLQIVGQRD